MPARPNPELKSGTLPFKYFTNSGYTNAGVRTFTTFARNWTGAKTPNFSNPKLRPKPLPANNYDVKVTERSEHLLRRYKWRRANPAEWDDWSDTPINLHSPIVTAKDHSYDLYHDEKAYGAALSRAQLRLKDMKVNLAQVFAERKQTVRTITDVAERLSKAMLMVKRGRMRDAAKALGAFDKKRPPKPTRNIANDWLALQYGWLPLLSDVKGSAELLAQHLATDQRKSVIRVSTRVVTSTKGAYDKTYVSSYGSSISWQETSHETAARVRLEYVVSSPSLDVLSQTGITDPLLLAWEVIPYSFVVDWFLPVGNFLQCLNYDLGLSFQRGYYSLRSKNTWEARLNGNLHISADGYNYRYDSGTAFTSKNVWFTRTKYLSSPRVELPKLADDPLNVKRALNALSLMRQAFGR